MCFELEENVIFFYFWTEFSKEMEFLEAVTSALRALLQMLASNNISQVSFLDVLASDITVSTMSFNMYVGPMLARENAANVARYWANVIWF